jgi:hypothetical protein
MMTIKERKDFREMFRRIIQLNKIQEMNEKTIWTYQDFFITFQEELKPLIAKWQKRVKGDVYMQHTDPVETWWREREAELKKTMRDDYYKATAEKLAQQREQLRKKCTCGKVK